MQKLRYACAIRKNRINAPKMFISRCTGTSALERNVRPSKSLTKCSIYARTSLYRCDPAQSEKKHRYIAAEFLNIPSFNKIIKYREELRLECTCGKVHLFRGASFELNFSSED